MAKKDVKELQKTMHEYHQKILKNGGALTYYFCHHCAEMIPTVQPTEDLVTGKGYWDSVTTCTNCGDMNFVAVYPDGRTDSQPFPMEKKRVIHVYRPNIEKKPLFGKKKVRA